MNSAIKRYGIFGLVFLGGLFFGAGLSQFVSHDQVTASPEQKIAADTQIISLLGEEVMSLTYHTEALTLTAQRSKPADPFAVQITFADGRKPQQCLTSPDLAGLLGDFSTITAKRQIQSPRFEAEFPQPLGTLEIRDRIVAEAPPAMLFRTTANRQAVALSYDGYTAEVRTSIDGFVKLEGGCEALVQR
ncbi:MAG: putative lipoprotein transrane [Proteobacteria bacterium]|nr:putative lipoprotein transrane [Pseudomonadota bacterium]